MSLFELMTTESNLDTMATNELIAMATEQPAAERAQALFCLSRHITEPALPQFLDLLELEQNQEPLMFGSMPINAAGIIALLVNSSGDVQEVAKEQWLNLPFVQRHDLISAFDGDDLLLPLRDSEEVALDQALETATLWLGDKDWRPRPSVHDGLIIVSEHHPGDQVVIVGRDGSALISSNETSWEDQQAFIDGKRSQSRP